MSAKIFFGLLVAAVFASSCYCAGRETECQRRRRESGQLLEQQSRNKTLGAVAILVPECNGDGTFASFQCTANSPFCQCFDKEGYPLGQPKKNLKGCKCMSERAEALKLIPASAQNGEIPITSCNPDGTFTPKQCNRQACWCVESQTGNRITADNKLKDKVSC